MDILQQIVQNYAHLIVLFLVAGILISVYADWFTPAQSFLLSMLILLVLGVIPAEEFLVAFSNKQVITIFILIFITVAIRQHVNVDLLFSRTFPSSLAPRFFVLKMTALVALCSSFLNNTPIVSMLTSDVQNWAIRKGLSPSKFLIPLSYAAILGGMITIIGTSTNLILQGLIESNGGLLLNLTDFMMVGGIVATVGILFLTFFSDRLLPERKLAIKEFKENIGQYLHEVELKEGSVMVGKSAIEAGLKNLEGIYLVEIQRNNEVITPVSPEVLIEQDDHLYFAGDTSLVVDFVRKMDDLMLSSENELSLTDGGNLSEVIISANSTLAGKQVKDSDFRQIYNASIVGIHRNGEKLSGKIGHLRLRGGDLLLLLTGRDFGQRITQDKNLHLISEPNTTTTLPAVKYKGIYWILQLFVTLLFIGGFMSFFISLLLSLFLLVSFKYLSIDLIKKNFNFDLLIVLACSLALGKAFIQTGASEMVSQFFLQMLNGADLRWVLGGLFIFTTVLTSLITNVAAVSIAFPVAFSLAKDLSANPSAFYLTIAFAASAAFLTPMAYQTNMMVYGPGGYKGKDFLKAGLPLLIIYMVTSMLTIYWWFDI